jgi:hypothetical protein
MLTLAEQSTKYHTSKIEEELFQAGTLDEKIVAQCVRQYFFKAET